MIQWTFIKLPEKCISNLAAFQSHEGLPVSLRSSSNFENGPQQFTTISMQINFSYILNGKNRVILKRAI